ncbi:programmed cell death 6-interacting protein isoform X2 [Pristis pectinata]|uniref:programmed cell death 6-interacting protein isoform X2 n=1 Tax=Pristis pectinata TaxID=685728 RepID=UPI00223CB943|nr:programmed cell death 6-interacting protein isoform X2 [Pristis pectinata]
MATTFVSVPLKKASEVDLAKPLSKFIAASYPSGEAQAEYVRAAEELNKLRKSAVGRPLDKHDSSLEILLRYYDQLCAIEPKFPFAENQLCLTFTWKDAFDKGSLFGGSVKLALASLGYEKSCVLFNIGALASQIAAEQNLENDEGLKSAAKYYQLASGVFQHIKDTVLSALNREPTMDISPDTVGTLSLIMLAQAQEVFFLKAAADKMKDAIIAKLANQAADYYGDAFKQCQYKENLPKEVLPVLAAKHCMMQANAEFHQSILAKQQKKFGEEIARLQHGSDLVKTVASRYDEYINVKDLSDKISRALTAAKKDNDFIYHDRVPDVKDLEAIGKATLVKSIPVNVPMSQKFTDLFVKMVPLAVQQALSIYNQRRADLVNRLIAQMRESTNLANGVLASLNLPAAVEDLSGDSVPRSILEKSSSVIQQGGLQTIDQLMKDLPDLLQRNREILDESLRILDQEEVTDNELKTKFKERWQRTPSSELYKPLRTEGANFRNTLDRAIQADKVVRERYATHSEIIGLLCKPEAELNAAIPSGNPTKSLQGSEVVMLLKTLLASLNEVKKERETLENDVKSVEFDMSTKFLTALAQDGAINEEAISVTELDRIYGSHTERVQKNLKKQEELLASIQSAHEEFSKSTQSTTNAAQREEVLKKLAAAHDQFVELVSNLREGTKFYNGLTEILLKFQTKCSDIVFARKTERDELLKDMQQSMAKEPSAPNIPAVPAYQTAVSVNESTPVPTPAPRTVFQSAPQAPERTPGSSSGCEKQPKPQPPARPPPPNIGSTYPAAPFGTAPPGTSAPASAPVSASPASIGGTGVLSQAQGPPYPSYQGYPGYYPMPMPMAYNQFAYGQYNVPYMFQPPGQSPFQSAQQPQQPGYPYPQQQYYQQ